MQTQWQKLNNLLSLARQDTFEPTTHCIVNLDYLGLIKVTGNRAKELLQGQFTCDLAEISAAKTSLGAHCNPQGRVISLFRLFYYHDSYYLQMPKTTIPLALTALKKYAVFFKVALTDASDEFIRIGYNGNQLKNFLTNIPEKIDEMIITNDILIIKMPGDYPRYEILGPLSAIETLWKKLIEEPQLSSVEVWKYLDIQAGIPHIYPETTEKFLPHEINLDKINAISFNKGCYTGQEIIARMQYRGKLKNRLYHATIHSEFTPQIGGDIFSEKASGGHIVDYCNKDGNNYELLVIANEKDRLFLDPLKHHRLIIEPER